MSERERFYRFMYYDLFLGGLNIYFRKKIVVEVKIKKDKESQCWGHGEPYCTPTFPFILFSSFPSSLLLLILLSTPFLLPRSLECPFFKKGLFWTLWSLFSGTSYLPTYSFVYVCAVFFHFWHYKYNLGTPSCYLGGNMWDLEANCKRITRNNADSFGIQLFVTFYDQLVVMQFLV